MKKQTLIIITLTLFLLQLASAIEDVNEENKMPEINVSIENIEFGKQPKVNLEIASPINNTITECAFRLFNQWKEYPDKIKQKGYIYPNTTHINTSINLTTMDEEGDFTFEIYCYDSEGYEGENDKDEFSIRKPKSTTKKEYNAPPKATAVAVLPLNATESDVLECRYTYSDFEGDAQTSVSFIWFRNGLEQTMTSQIIPQTKTLSQDRWRCAVQVSDSYGRSELVFSPYSIILNSNIPKSSLNALITLGGNGSIVANSTAKESEGNTAPTFGIPEGNTTETLMNKSQQEKPTFPYIYIIIPAVSLLAIGITSIRMVRKRKFELAKKTYFENIDAQNNEVIVEDKK